MNYTVNFFTMSTYPLQTVDVFGKWERFPMGGMYLQPGDYLVQIILTQEFVE